MADEIVVPQTDAELVTSLGWDLLPEDVPTPVETAPTPAGDKAPVTTPGAVTNPVVTPPVPDQLVQARAQLRSEQAQLTITRAALQYKEQLVAGGMDAAQAQTQADAAAAAHWANFQRDAALDQANEMAKAGLVRELASEHGVAPEMLQGFNDPDSMRAAAKIYGAQGKELAGLKEQMSKNKTPVQPFDGGAGSTSNARSAARSAYNAGGPSLTAAEFQAKFGYDPR